MERYARKPAVAPGIASVLLSPDVVRFETSFWDGPTHSLNDVDEDGTLRQLVELLDGSRTVDEIVTEVGDMDEAEIQGIVADLFELGIVHDASQPRNRYAHLCSAETENRTIELDTELPSLLVIGDETLGTSLATTLDGAELEDFTFARLSDAREGSVSSSGPAEKVTVEGDTDLSSLVSDADITVVATERPRPELLDTVNRTAERSETPWLPVRVIGSDALVGPLIDPGTTACYECYRTRSAANASDPEALRAFREQSETGPVPIGLRHIAIGITVDRLARFVCYRDERFVGRVTRFGLGTETMEVEDVLPVPNCPVCRSDTSSPSAVPTVVDGETDD